MNIKLLYFFQIFSILFFMKLSFICLICKKGIFAKRNIEAFEELCFHYGDDCIQQSMKTNNTKTKRRKCLCGSNICQNFLPNIGF